MYKRLGTSHVTGRQSFETPVPFHLFKVLVSCQLKGVGPGFCIDGQIFVARPKSIQAAFRTSSDREFK